MNYVTYDQLEAMSSADRGGALGSGDPVGLYFTPEHSHFFAEYGAALRD